MTSVDVHQHGWGPGLVKALRRRREPPFLRDWTLYLHGEPPYPVRPADHDPARRARLVRDDGLDRALISLSSPLGVEWLPPDEAEPLLAAYHEDAVALPEPFGAWAAACVREIDPEALGRVLDRGFAGLQLPADALADAAGYRRCAPLLDLLEARGLPLFVHPGPAGQDGREGPGWWAAMVPYAQQMHAAWFAFRAFGRPRHPRLRVCFAMLAGLAPLHGERLAARGGGRGEVDPDTFVETSSYGPRAVDATVRALGVDVIVHGSDRPYASPREPDLGDAARHAFRTANPRRLLTGKEHTDGPRRPS
ncbi:Predicted metal-dependent hydrolase, TIM-barrel fold [Thermomonospora echinospora]|uniref:Predicted metal-dependent hydrolase, TIM-barrel fold n=1 Tax=Thermomonospora echinospora TaxID=1992 RepID=A0A1H5V2K2_9ACTN|nr:amidohydrolase family protein [Thermomonospora echinospora]SEF80958.1 Predicted metal-dependent hydrolase, TIM-barrel fold [Thermomonospora echinospora]